MSGVGLSGSHGSGKSTLAQACCDEFGIKFVQSNASQVITNAGFNPGLGYDFETRLMLQELILADAVESYKANEVGNWISDRTPLDFLTYLLSDVGRNDVSDELAVRLAAYQKSCYDAINRYFNVVVIVQPGIKLIEREGKGLPNAAYAEHFNALLSGLAISPAMLVQQVFIPRHVVDLSRRVCAVNESVKVAFNSFERVAARKGATLFSKLIH